jgi:tRNA (guanine37-N1)-methyltransferase
MRFDVITLFPEMFEPHLRLGITRRAFAADQVDVRLWPLRDHADGGYRRVDDRPFGGGPGMVLLAAPLLRAVDAVLADRRAPCEVIHFSPSGVRLTQPLVRQLAQGPGAVLVCGRYEGVDQRFLDARVTLEISLGDYVLSGGELPALVLLDAIARLQPGVLTVDSAASESFEEGLLEGPCYSRPESLVIDGAERRVPAVLLAGHHAEADRFRRQQALWVTAKRRPDLIEMARKTGKLDACDEADLRQFELQ